MVSIHDVGLGVLCRVPRSFLVDSEGLVGDGGERGWRLIMLMLSVRDLCRLECCSRTLLQATRDACFESFQLRLEEETRWGENDEASCVWMCRDKWCTAWGVRFQLCCLHVAKLSASQKEISCFRLKMEEELRQVREVCEFLTQQKSVKQFSDKATVNLFETFLKLTSEHDPLSFLPAERLALSNLTMGLAKLAQINTLDNLRSKCSLVTTDTPPASMSQNPISSNSKLGDPVLDPRRFFHSLLTEFGRFVNGLRRLQKVILKWNRELILLRRNAIDSIESIRTQLNKIITSLHTNESQSYTQDAKCINEMMDPLNIPSFLSLTAEEKIVVDRFGNRSKRNSQLPSWVNNPYQQAYRPGGQASMPFQNVGMKTDDIHGRHDVSDACIIYRVACCLTNFNMFNFYLLR